MANTGQRVENKAKHHTDITPRRQMCVSVEWLWSLSILIARMTRFFDGFFENLEGVQGMSVI